METEHIKSRLHLLQTKLKNIQENLQRKDRLREALRMHREISSELRIHSQRLTELKREEASASTRISALERFETFETMQYPLLSVKAIEEETAHQRQISATLQQEIDSIAPILSEKEKEYGLSEKAVSKDRSALNESIEMNLLYHKNLGALHILSKQIRQLQNIADDIDKNIEECNLLIDDVKHNGETLDVELDNTRQLGQSLAPHQSMIEQVQGIIVNLRHLNELREHSYTQQREYDNALRNEEIEQERLSRAYQEFQQLNGEINSLENQVGIYRYNIKGKNSYHLQSKAFGQRTRHSQLISARSLWSRICTGYNYIEFIEDRLTELSHNIAQHERNIAELERETFTLKQLAQEKLHTWNMSKSQDIVTMRNDLHEGEACPVCGAMVHPYHSESLLEQTHFISELRKDYESLEGELHGKENFLHDEHDALITAQAEKRTLEHILKPIQQRQEEDVEEWGTYAHLDPTFAECTRFTDQNSRSALLGQLIDNAHQNADIAREELEDYNSNQQLIGQLTEQITDLTKRKDEVMDHFNEINTALQVHAGTAERIRARQDKTEKAYQRGFEMVASVITIPDWFTAFTNNPDEFEQRLLQMAERWHSLQQKEHSLQSEKALCEENLRLLNDRLTQLKQEKISVGDILSSVSSEELQYQQEQECITPNHIRADIYYAQSVSNLQQSETDCQETLKNIQQLRKQNYEKQAQMQLLQELSRQASARTHELSTTIDHWIHIYNSAHQPVQIGEMKAVLTQDFDWTSERAQLRNLHVEILLEQQRVDIIQSRLVAIEAETGSVTQEGVNTMLSSIIGEQKELEDQLNETLIEIAQIKTTLQP